MLMLFLSQISTTFVLDICNARLRRL